MTPRFRVSMLCSTLLASVALVLVPISRAAADTAPPAGYQAGSGQFQGTETVQDEQFLGIPCFKTTKSIFGLQGVGTYQGVTAGGQTVSYKAEIAPGQQIYDGPLHLEVENTELYYHGPNGTAGPTDSTCSTSGIDVTAEFRIWATDHVYELDGTGAQVPCVGHGTFARGPNSPDWHAQWTLDADCTVVGNPNGIPGTGVAKAGTGFTDSGTHEPCSDVCQDNIQVDYVQYLPFVGPHLGLTGPATQKTGTQATMTANDTTDGQPVSGASVSFSVSGPGPTSPSSGTGTTGADGRAAFSFTTLTVGTFTVTATSGSLTATQQVQFVPPAPPKIVLQGLKAAQTQENVYVAAVFTNDDQPVQNVSINFSVSGPGTATPSTGTATTDQIGIALFSFSADRAGSYTVTATTTYVGKQATGTLTIPLQINTFFVQDTLTVPPPSSSGLMDPTGRYAYIGTNNGLQKVDLHTFRVVDTVTVPDGGPAMIDPAGKFAYLTGNLPGLDSTLTKVALSSFKAVATLTFPSDQRTLRSGVIDPTGHYAYFGLNFDYTAPGRVAKVDLQTMQEVGIITFGSDETSVDAAAMSPAGDYAYFVARGAGTIPARLVKVDLATFSEVGSLPMADRDENNGQSILIDPAGHYAYLALHTASGTSDFTYPSDRIVKVDLTTFSRAGYIQLEPWSAYFDSGEEYLKSAVMDPAGNFAYFGTGEGSVGRGQARVLRIDLRTFQERSPITVDPLKTNLGPAVIAPDGKTAYFGGSSASGSEIFQIALSRAPNPALVASNDTYSTPYVTPLHVAAPGVLANDVNNADAYPLAAGQASDPPHGTVTLNADGSFDYTPDAGFTGTDSFTYTANNAKDYSAPATVTITVGAAPQGVQAVGGGAMGWYTNVGLFGGPQSVQGGTGSTCGQAGQAACATGQSPAVALAPTGGDLSASDPDGNLGAYGPAHVFENDGPITVHTTGTTGPGGSVTSSAEVDKVEDNDPFRAASPDGLVSSTCTASQTALSGATHITNGTLVLHTDPTTGDPTQTVVLPHDWDPAPNTEYNGALDHIGDHWRIVFNEQVFGPESIAVNAVHMYMLGSIAVGDMIIGQSRCAVTTAQANAAPVAQGDAYSAVAGHSLVVAAPGLLGNDTDADGQALSASKVLPTPPPTSGGGNWTFPSDPAHGSLTLNGDGSFTYTATPGYAGPDSFSYVATDSRGKSSTATVTMAVALPPNRPPADFDGNGTTDVAVFRPSTGAWFVGNSPPTYLGLSGDVAVPCDYDGDGRVDRAVFRDGAWYVGSNAPVFLGLAGDVPVPGDYDGDGHCERAVYRPSTGAWYVGANAPVYLGGSGDIAVPADYNGDGATEIAVYRPSTGAWYVGSNAPAYLGLSGDVPVPGDYDGNGTTDLAVFRPSTGAWYVGNSAPTYLGLSGDVPVPGDYDGNRTADLAVFRPSTGTWFVGSNPPTYLGLAGDVPLPLSPAIRQSLSG